MVEPATESTKTSPSIAMQSLVIALNSARGMSYQLTIDTNLISSQI
ncbi:hypothetical protein VCR3J2_230073 [Vibrio coralliirubri]|nr:hypothetical protein VCR3J2_230073 [Vibrio coralliirubri]CDT82969.1 hypothetical protein VCR12J2_1060064 [Vibrio coralliirubri]